MLLSGWFGRILQSLLSDNEGCASKLCMFLTETNGAGDKAFFKLRQEMQRLLLKDNRKYKNRVNLSLYFIIKSTHA